MEPTSGVARVSTLATNLRSGMPQRQIPVSISPDATRFAVSSTTSPTPLIVNRRLLLNVVHESTSPVESYIKSVAKAGALVVVKVERSRRPNPLEVPS